MKKVLVTGGAGFIGRYCIPKLIHRGYEVYAIYRKNILDEFDQVKWIQADLLDRDCISEVVKQIGAEYLLHLAWDVTPGEYKNSSNNLKWVTSSLELIQRFVDAGGKRIVTAGTCFEYDFADGILNEETTALKPDTLYGECKAALYKMVKHYCAVQGISYAHGRIFYPYGLGDDPNKVIPYVIRSLLKGENPKCGSGQDVLDYIYVEDVANAFVTLLDSNIIDAVNIGTGQGIRVKDLLLMIEKEIGGEGHIEFSEPDGKSAHRVVADNRRLVGKVDWKLARSLKENLLKMI